MHIVAIYKLCECEALYRKRYFHLGWPVTTQGVTFEVPSRAINYWSDKGHMTVGISLSQRGNNTSELFVVPLSPKPKPQL